MYGTGLSAISFMAVPAKTYATDWAYFMTKLPQILVPIIVCWLFIPFYRKLDITTAYEYLEKRFNLATRLIGSSVDITTASGDVTEWVCEVGGTSSSVWRLVAFVDVSVDNSAGA